MCNSVKDTEVVPKTPDGRGIPSLPLPPRDDIRVKSFAYSDLINGLTDQDIVHKCSKCSVAEVRRPFWDDITITLFVKATRLI